jgi:hypothetical protein
MASIIASVASICNSIKVAAMPQKIRHGTAGDLPAIVAIYNASIPGRLGRRQFALYTAQ